MIFARCWLLWRVRPASQVSWHVSLSTSAPLAGTCFGSSLLMALLAVRSWRRALLLYSFEVVGLVLCGLVLYSSFAFLFRSFFFLQTAARGAQAAAGLDTRVALQQYPKEKHENETIPHSSCGYTRKRVLP